MRLLHYCGPLRFLLPASPVTCALAEEVRELQDLMKFAPHARDNITIIIQEWSMDLKLIEWSASPEGIRYLGS